jgi:hypothetical protein
LKIYPSSSVEISLGGQYSAYSDVSDLSTLYGSANIAYVKADLESPLSVYLSTGVSGLDYGQIYSVYDHLQFGASAALRYAVSPKVHVTIGGDLLISDYANAETGDNRGVGIYGGINAGFGGVNTINIEAGGEVTEFTGLDNLFGNGGGPWSDFPELENKLQTIYGSARFSRPLGEHTGIGVEYAFRSFVGDDDVVTYGLSLDNLSPWTAFWEGQAVSANIKSYLLPGFILTAAFQYRYAEYMDALETDDIMGPETADDLSLRSREDDRYQGTFGLSRPISLRAGGIITPSLTITYTDNVSSLTFYDYSSLAVSASVNVSF